LFWLWCLQSRWRFYGFSTPAKVWNDGTGLILSLERYLAGLPALDQAPDVLLGRSDAWKANDIAVELMVNTLLTWILPYLDPPTFVQRWISNARSRWVTTLRKSSVYVAYGVWLFVVFTATAFVAWSLTLLAGYDTSGDEKTQLIRLGGAGILALATVLLLSVWLFVRFLRRGKSSNAFTNPPAFVQRWVANAQTRLSSILRNGVVYIGYVISLSVVFAVIIFVLVIAKDIITNLAGQKPTTEDLIEFGLDLLVVLSVIALGVLLVKARNTSRVELRRRLRRSFIWSIALGVGFAVPPVSLIILVAHGVINEPRIFGLSLTDDLALLAQSPFLFALDHLAATLVGGIVTTPCVYGVIWLEDNARTKHRHSVAASIIIAPTLMIITAAWFVLLAGGFGFLIAGADGRDIGAEAGRVIGAATGLGLTWWLVVRRWPTPMVARPLAEPAREITSIPEDIADAVRASAARPL
jgi:hypothetical protein